MLRFSALLLSYLISLDVWSDGLPSKVTLATTDWCPYACENGDNFPGITHEYISRVFKDRNIELTIQFFPWTRAIQLAQSGKVDGLLTAVKSEAPNLIFTSVPTDTYQMCFFTRWGNPWEYTNSDSLKSAKLGIIQNYGYGEPVDQHVQSSPDRIYTITGGGIPRLYKMLMSKRFDAFIDDSKVVRWALKGSVKDLKQVGCLASNPFYLAIHPDRPWAKPLVTWLDKQLPATRDRLRAIQQSYY